MAGLTARLIAINRARYASLLPDTAVVLAVTRADDGAGGLVASVAPSAAVPCRVAIDRRPGEKPEGGAQIVSGAGFKVCLPFGTPVSATSRIRVSSGRGLTAAQVLSDPAARTYEVIAPEAGNGEAFGLVVTCEYRE